MKKLSYKFTYSSLQAIFRVIETDISLQPENDYDKLTKAILIKLHQRIQNKLYFTFDSCRFGFEVHEYIALKLTIIGYYPTLDPYIKSVYTQLELTFGPKL